MLPLLVFNSCTDLDSEYEVEPHVYDTTEYFETGYASWYGPGFQGNLTASGDTFDMYELTAAHKTLNFHTFIEVTNLNNMKKVIVEINDRGPFVDDRIIDLSKAAADSIDMINDGVVMVGLRYINAK